MGLGWKLEYNHPHLIPLHIKGEERRGRERENHHEFTNNGEWTPDIRLQQRGEREK
jgi:hypothetical protein